MTLSTTSPPRLRLRPRRRALAAAALAALATATAAASAQADSIAFVKDHNVWLANPDGSGQYQVTTDGTADNPYQSPSQADDGTIATVRAKPNGGPIIRLEQNGSVISSNKVYASPFGPYEPAISPDGRYVAYEAVYRDTMGTHSEVHYVNADGSSPPGAYPLGGPDTGAPSWIDSTHAFFGDYTQALTQVPGQSPVRWWNDWDLQPRYFDSSEDLNDGEVAPNGTIAFVRGDRDGNTIQLYQSTGPAALPTPTCVLTGPTAGPLGQRFSDPTFSPAGDALAWQEGDGIWGTALTIGNCAASAPKLIVPGASEPDWGPAPVNPGPRETPIDPARESIRSPERTRDRRREPRREPTVRRSTVPEPMVLPPRAEAAPRRGAPSATRAC